MEGLRRGVVDPPGGQVGWVRGSDPTVSRSLKVPPLRNELDDDLLTALSADRAPAWVEPGFNGATVADLNLYRRFKAGESTNWRQ